MDSDNRNRDDSPDMRPLDPSLRLETVPYQPDGGWPPQGLACMFAVAALAAVGLGYLCSWTSQWFYIIILFPFLVGLGVGVFGYLGVSVGKVRSTRAALLAGLFAGFLAMGTMHYANYQRELARAAAWAGQPRETFAQFIDGEARKGQEIRLRRLHFRLPYVLTYVYWIVEFFLAAGPAIFIMWMAASEPFCSLCQTWKPKRVLGTLGLAPEEAVTIFASGEIIRLANLDFQSGQGRIRLTATPCPHCGIEAPVDVKLEHLTRNAKDEEQAHALAHVTYPGQALPILESLFRPTLDSDDIVVAEVDDRP